MNVGIIGYGSMGRMLLERFAEAVSESGSVEKKPKLEGRQMIMFIAPLKK